jgi:hypothetical protein
MTEYITTLPHPASEPTIEARISDFVELISESGARLNAAFPENLQGIRGHESGFLSMPPDLRGLLTVFNEGTYRIGQLPGATDSVTDDATLQPITIRRRLIGAGAFRSGRTDISERMEEILDDEVEQ